MLSRVGNKESQNLFPFMNMTGKHGSLAIHLNNMVDDNPGIVYVLHETCNTELNDLRNLFVQENLVSVEIISVYKVINYLVEHGRLLHQIFNDFILSAMLLHQ